MLTTLSLLQAFTALKELHSRVDGLPSSPTPAPSIDTVITPRSVAGGRSCDGVVIFQVRLCVTQPQSGLCIHYIISFDVVLSQVYPQSALQGRRNPTNFKINIREGRCVCTCMHVCGYVCMHACICVCVCVCMCVFVWSCCVMAAWYVIVNTIVGLLLKHSTIPTQAKNFVLSDTNCV